MAIITISGEVCSGRRALAENLGGELGYRVLSQEGLLRHAAMEFRVSERLLESALMHRPSFSEDCEAETLHSVHCVQAAMAKAARSDSVVYHGHAGHLLGGVPHHLRIKAVADLEYRIDAVMERCELNREDAIRYIKSADEERKNWVTWIYSADANEPLTFDVAINLAHVSVANACQAVAQTARRRYRITPESNRIVDNIILASVVRARIGLDRSICNERIHVEADDGVVTITGNARSSDDVERMRELTLRVRGVKGVRSKVSMC